MTPQDDRDDLVGRLTDRWIPEDMQSDPELCRRVRFAVGTALTPLPIVFFFALLYYLTAPGPGWIWLVAALLGGVPFYVASLPLIRLFRSPTPTVCVALATGLTQVATICWMTGGIVSPSLVWILPIPSIVLLMGGRTLGIVSLVACGAVHALFYLRGSPTEVVSREYIEALAIPGVLFFMLYTMGIFGLYERIKDAAVQRLRALNERLDQARNEAQTANQSKSSFLSRMSHEIRTPLMAILGFTDLLDEEVASRRGSKRVGAGSRAASGSSSEGPESTAELDRDDSEALLTVRRNGEHLLHIIDDLLDLSRIESESLRISRTSVALGEFLDEVIGLVSMRAQHRGIGLELECSPDLPACIETDLTRLRQVLVNLLTNAIKFTESGRVVLRATTIDAPSPALELAVEDSGIGMTREQVEALFQPFMQATPETARLYGGSGLGLVISKRLTEALGGRIDARSELGVGSVFSLRFPLDELVPDHPPSTADERARAATARPVLTGQRILVVDDFPDNRVLLSRILTRAGADVHLAESGEAALDQVSRAEAQACPFDLILMDVQMPGMDGCAATTELRARRCESIIVALTADALSSTRERCLASGFDAHATKPIQRERLLELARDTRARSDSMRESASLDSRERSDHGVSAAPRSWIARAVAHCVPPELREDRDALRRATMVLSFAVCPLPFLGIAAWVFPQVFPADVARVLTALYLGIAPLCMAVALLLRLTGSIRWAGNLTLGYASAVILGTAVITGGSRSCMVPWLAVLPIWALPIVGRRGAATWLGGVAASVLVLLGLEQLGFDFHDAIFPDKRTLAFLVGHSSLMLLLLLLASTYEHAKSDSMRRYERTNLELVRARDTADAAREAKERFLATVSHEMRTPMTAILGFSELLHDAWRRHGPPSDEAVELLARVEHNGAHLLGLLNDVLDLSKIEAGKLEIESFPVWTAQLIEQVLGPARAHARARRVRFRVRIDPNLPEGIRGDRARLEQLLRKLLEGALDSAEKCQLTLRIGARQRAARTDLVFAIERSVPPGESAQPDLEHAWIGTWGSPDGSGGLLSFTLARSLSRLLGGELSLHSDSNSGELIELCLPVERIERSPVEQVGSSPTLVDAEHRLRDARILLAEDSPDSQRLIAHVLRQAGARVDVVPDGRSALACALGAGGAGTGSDLHDIVLMDMQMPILSGEEATTRLRRGGYRGPIVALTADADPAVRERCMRLGCNAFVTKPIDREALLSALAGVLHAADLRTR